MAADNQFVRDPISQSKLSLIRSIGEDVGTIVFDQLAVVHAQSSISSSIAGSSETIVL